MMGVMGGGRLKRQHKEVPMVKQSQTVFTAYTELWEKACRGEECENLGKSTQRGDVSIMQSIVGREKWPC